MHVQAMLTPHPPNPFLARYDDMDAKPMEVISHLYYRMCVAELPAYEQVQEMRTWTGGPKARVPAQSVAYVNPAVDPPLALAHVLEVLDWLFAEVPVVSGSAGSELPPEMTHLLPSERPQYLTRLQCVNAQPIAAGLRNTKHRPYDMLAAVFLCSEFMHASDGQMQKLRAHEFVFKQMYLQQSTQFDYQSKDVFAHNHVTVGRSAPLDQPLPMSPLEVFVGVSVLVFVVVVFAACFYFTPRE